MRGHTDRSWRKMLGAGRLSLLMPKSNVTREWIGLNIVLASLCLTLTTTHILRRADLAFLDTTSQFVHRAASEPVVVIAVDDRTVRHFGEWPLSGRVHAQLVNQLTRSQVAAIGIDLVVPDAPDLAKNNADPLAAAIKRNGKVVMRLVSNGSLRSSIDVLDSSVSKASFASGHVAMHSDEDGVFRSVYMLTGDKQDELHMSMQLLRASGRFVQPCTEQEKNASSVGVKDCLRYVPLGKKNAFQTYSYLDVWEGKVPAADLRGRIVLIGAVGDGTSFLYATSIVGSSSISDVEFLGEVTNALLTSTLTRPASLWQELLFNEWAVPLISLSLYFLGPRAGLFSSVVFAMLIVIGAFALLLLEHLNVSPASGVLTCLVAYPLWSWRRLETLLNYLSQEVVRVKREPSLPEVPRAKGIFTDRVQSRLNDMQLAIERVRRYREFVSEWVDSLPEASLITTPAGIVILANERVYALSRHSDIRSVEHRSPAGRPVSDVLFEITASHRAEEFVAQALSSLGHLAEAKGFSSLDASSLTQGIEITDARVGRSLLMKCAPIKPAAGREGALIFHVADVSTVRTAERQRDMALRFLSHDMRSSQASVLALVEQMRQEPPRFSADRFIELVDQYATTALNLSDDFLFLARAENLPPKLAPIDPALVLGDAIDDLWPQASAKSTVVNLFAEPGKTTIADVKLLRRAFGNLISNAIKFSPHSSAVDVRLNETDRDLKISVIDRGIGITDQEKTKLFQEFSQVEMKSLGLSGYGLGLAFVKTVIDSFGGRLMIQSEAGQGATFIVFLPKVEINAS